MTLVRWKEIRVEAKIRSLNQVWTDEATVPGFAIFLSCTDCSAREIADFINSDHGTNFTRSGVIGKWKRIRIATEKERQESLKQIVEW